MSDRYTKSVLTVIAAALLGILLQNAIGSSRAQSDGIQKVQICAPTGIDIGCVGLKHIQGIEYPNIYRFALEVDRFPLLQGELATNAG